jgi:predicted unusual protein kinase regulating ubiquinone biosynthesis (AarF/ABC1/UbiB family)
MTFRRLIKIFFTLLPSFTYYYFDRKKALKSEDLREHYTSMRNNAKKMVDKFMELGPAFIKLGQLLSVRADVLPQPYMDEFVRLQDQVPPAKFEEIKKILNEDLGDISALFEEFNPVPISAASLGQVHEAKYKGKGVVVKVLRPGIGKIIDEDVSVIRRLLPLLSIFIGRAFLNSFRAAVDQFYDTVYDEMDYLKEAENMKKLKVLLSSYSYVIVPDIFSEISTRRVIVMERIDGIKVTDVQKLDKNKIDRTKIASMLSRLYLVMVLKMEIFHADPHPGNISILNDGKIVLYDFGMVGSLSKDMRDKMMWLYMALATRNTDDMIDALIDLEVLDPFVNRYVIAKGIEMALNEMEGFKVSESDVRMLMYAANRVIYRFPFRLPKQLVLYLRMGLMLDSVCRTLDPEFNFIQTLPSLFEQEGLYREYYIFRVKQIAGRVTKYLDSALRLPTLMQEYYQLEIERERKGSSVYWGVAGIIIGFVIATSIFFILH